MRGDIEHLKQLFDSLEQQHLDALLVTKAENVFYLSGFSGGSDARLLVSPEHRYLFTDARYLEQAQRECPDWEICNESPSGWDSLVDASRCYDRVGFESHNISYQFYLELQKHLPVELVPLTDEVERLRILKKPAELILMRQSAAISDEVFQDICHMIRPGLKERSLAAHVDYLLRQKGCDKEAFDTIAVSGTNAALPHGHPGDKEIAPGEMVTLDFGGFFRGYASDMTRTVVLDQPSQYLREVYAAVLEAQQTAVAAVAAGVHCREVDRCARRVLEDHSLQQYFVHSTGHGVGLEIHEKPVVSSRSDVILEENMVITIEPGVYIPGWGGVRIEDTVIVQKGGCEIITRSNKELYIL